MRIAFFALVVALGFWTPWWLFSIAAVVYAFQYTAYELMLLGVLLDVSTGVRTFSVIPFPCLYTGALTLLVLSMYYVKPFLAIRSKIV